MKCKYSQSGQFAIVNITICFCYFQTRFPELRHVDLEALWWMSNGYDLIMEYERWSPGTTDVDLNLGTAECTLIWTLKLGLMLLAFTEIAFNFMHFSGLKEVWSGSDWKIQLLVANHAISALNHSWMWFLLYFFHSGILHMTQMYDILFT